MNSKFSAVGIESLGHVLTRSRDQLGGTRRCSLSRQARVVTAVRLPWREVEQLETVH
jgi:hypothetical protein